MHETLEFVSMFDVATHSQAAVAFYGLIGVLAHVPGGRLCLEMPHGRQYASSPRLVCARCHDTVVVFRQPVAPATDAMSYLWSSLIDLAHRDGSFQPRAPGLHGTKCLTVLVPVVTEAMLSAPTP